MRDELWSEECLTSDLLDRCVVDHAVGRATHAPGNAVATAVMIRKLERMGPVLLPRAGSCSACHVDGGRSHDPLARISMPSDGRRLPIVRSGKQQRSAREIAEPRTSYRLRRAGDPS